MKKIIIPIGALLLASMAHAQLSPTENYVYSKTYLDYDTNNVATKTSETVQYFDGLGRPKQVVNIKASPTGKDVVTPIEYDGFGRQIKDYLPVPQSQTLNGAIVPNPLTNATQPTIYGQEKIYAEKKLEDSPLDRLLEQKQVGTAWNDKPVKFEYGTNTASEVKKYVVVTSYVNGNVSSSIGSTTTNYSANQLYKTTVTDEDGNKTIDFKNGKGQVLLVRKIVNATENADTYYVYNEYNQLAFVIPPKASIVANVNTVINDLCYIYRYDGRNRLIVKKLPGKGYEFMVYDKQDRLIMTQDAVMGANKQWLFTKYDQFGRPVYTGIYTSTQIYGTAGRAVEQTKADAAGSNNVVRTASVGFNVGGRGVYYDNTTSTSYPNSITTLLSINYYDTYPVYGFNPTFPTNILGIPVMTDNSTGNAVSTKSLPVMSMVRNIEDTNWTSSYTYYDSKGRAIGTHSINHLGGYTRTETELDFAGVAKKVNTTHLRKLGEIGVSIQERFVYDAQNRLKQHYHQVNSGAEELLTDNSYNELSQLNNKKVGNNLQSIDYNYNIRGWLTDINKNQMTIANLEGKLFSYKIKYNQKEGVTNPDSVLFPGKNVEVKYNGNIAEVDWRAVETIGANPSLTPKRYGYAYDKLNRLTAGYYQNPSNPNSKENTESIDYDLNGNISKLYRTSVMQNTIATVIDNLEYKYAGSDNKLTSIKDYANNSTGYEGGENTIGYDLNGNMTDMLDKGITTIKYNYLNLSNKLDYSKNGNESVTVNTKYRADGSKLQKETITTTTGIIGSSTSKKITDYLDGFQYLRIETPNSGGSEEFAANLETSRALETEAYSLIIPVDEPTLEATNPELQFFPTAEGFYDYAKSQYIYQYKDHLGNVRISFARGSAGALEITDSNDYYPFGMNHLKTGNSFFGPSAYKNYKYNSKELQETGMYDYGARMYMADIGRWGVIDAYSEKHTDNSGYNYSINNPIFFKDPDGNKILIYYGDDNKYSAEYSYQKDRNYDQLTEKFGGYVADTYKALDALYGASNIEIDGKEVNVVETLINDKRELSVIQGSETSFSSGRSLKEKMTGKGDGENIGTLKFANTKGVLFDDTNDTSREDLKKQLQSGEFAKTARINSPTSTLGHDLAHAYDFTTSTNGTKTTNEYEARRNDLSTQKGSPYFGNKQEKYATEISTKININLKETPRTNHRGTSVVTTGVLSNKIKK